MSTQSASINDNVIAVAAVQLMKFELLGTVHSITMHWRRGVSDRDKMRGIAVEEALKAKPGFSVQEVLVDIIQPNIEVRS